MIAQADLRDGELFSTSRASIVADALTSLPTAHFNDLDSTTYSINTCVEMLVDAARGDRARIWQWVRQAARPVDERRHDAVLHAVCNAIVADAFRSQGAVSGIGTFAVSIEREIADRLSIDRRRGAQSPGAYPANAEQIRGFMRIVELHDPHTAAHLEATATLARRIAVAMQLPLQQVATIEYAARLHDIGKLSIRRELLRKSGPLSAAELSELRRHVERGAAALDDLPELATLAPIVRAQYERMDGDGFPDRLSAEQIPFETRVLAVADALASMTSPHAYRAALSTGDALQTLVQNADTQFDGEVVAATIRLISPSAQFERKIA